MHRRANRPPYRSIYPVLCFFFCLSVLVASGCSVFLASPTPTATATPSPLPTPAAVASPHAAPLPTSTPWPTATPEPPDTGWQPLRSGVDLRQICVEKELSVENGTFATPSKMSVAERLTIVRLDPTIARFRVCYDPVVPRPVSTWAEQLRPFLLVNGGYFSPENETVGLLVSDGQVWGVPYGDFAGMFAVAPDGQISIRWFRNWPYDPDEPLQEAIQSFPVLIKPGGVMGFPADADDGRPARRTVVAQDDQGRILVIVAPRGYLGLHDLAVFLADSDLDLDVALNLDGGYSTGMWLEAGDRSVEIDSLVPVPSVLVVDFPP